MEVQALLSVYKLSFFESKKYLQLLNKELMQVYSV
jgi:hypothetical protein